MVSWKSSFQIRSHIFKIPTSKSIFGQIWTEKAFPVYFFLRPCCCFWKYGQFWFYILILLYIPLLHFTGVSKRKCLYFYFMVYIYIYIYIYIYSREYIFVYIQKIYIYIYIFTGIYICIYIFHIYIYIYETRKSSKTKLTKKQRKNIFENEV